MSEAETELTDLRELVQRRERLHSRVHQALERLADAVQSTPEPFRTELVRSHLALGNAYTHARTVLAEDANLVGRAVDKARDRPDWSRPRRCTIPRECCLCQKRIGLYARYQTDSLLDRPAHEACVTALGDYKAPRS